MLIFWLMYNDGVVARDEIRRKHKKILKVVAHTVITKSILYAFATIFSLGFLLTFLCSTIVCAVVHAVWFLCRLDVEHLTLSTETCNSLETELISQEMARAKDVQSDWVTVDLETDTGLKCTMTLHSLICISNRDTAGSSCSSATNSSSTSTNSHSCSTGLQAENYTHKYDNGFECILNESEHRSKSKKPVLLWLHGAGGTAMLSFGISGIIDRLADDYDIYALDLPGFGRSTIIWPDDSPLRTKTVEEICEIFVEGFVQFLKIKNLSNVYLVGHSFGAYHAINFAGKHPNLVKKLLVVDPGGMFPIQCKEGAFMAILFKWGVPMFYLRSLGSVGFQLYHTFLRLRAGLYPEGSWGKRGALLLSYWYQVQAAQDGVADIIMGKFFDVEFFTANGASPVYKRFLGLKMPVAIGYGEKDRITPPHQGLILSGLCGSTVPVYMISRAGHLPMRKAEGKDFATLVNLAYKNAKHIKEDSSGFLELLPITKGGADFGSDIRSYFSTECTLGNMIKFYDFILLKRREALSPTTACLQCPVVANIEGDRVTECGHHFPISDHPIQAVINKHFLESDKLCN